MKNWVPSNITEDDIIDGNAYHNALYHNGNINTPRAWYKESLEQLITSVMPYIEEGMTVIDYGSGTGGSVVELLKSLDKLNIKLKEIILIDPLKSWFNKAYDLLSDRENISFHLGMKIPEGVKADIIICSSTFHLIPPKAMPKLAMNLKDSLVDDGVLFWNSGDIYDSNMPSNGVLLHDPFRKMRQSLKAVPIRKQLFKDDEKLIESSIDKIFPPAPKLDVIKQNLKDAGLNGKTFNKVVYFSLDDAFEFISVPRLAHIAYPLNDEKIFREHFDLVLKDGYNTIWTYGVFHK